MATSHAADVIIIGGGLVGTLLALSLAQNQLHVHILEQHPLPDLTQPTYDGRTSAIAYGSAQILDHLHLWANLVPHSAPIHKIHVASDGHHLSFCAEELGLPAMGYMVENQRLRQEAIQLTKGVEFIHWHAPAAITEMTIDTYTATVTLADETILKAPLVVGADGRHSPTRAAQGIKTLTWQYDQIALVGMVQHPRSHDSIAFEHFLPTGPLALLPLPGGHRSAFVWSAKTPLAQTLQTLSPEKFSALLTHNFSLSAAEDSLGPLTLDSPLWTYPLSGLLARQVTQPRFALIGDGAHVLHPVAGQGLNLGIRDVQALTDTLREGYRRGLDIGHMTTLSPYQKARRWDNMRMAGVTDGLIRLFSTNAGSINWLRTRGLELVDHWQGAKEKLIQQATGLGR